ncbi:MAG: C39 family peptidase [Terriglobia bacterium]
MPRRFSMLAAAFLTLVCLGAAAPAGLWLDVPFVRQPENGCGAACIVMVVRYWVGKGAHLRCAVPTVESVQDALYRPRARGILASQMKSFLQQAGFRVFTFHGAQTDLADHLAKGRPLIVCLREPGIKSVLHYVVVAGLDRGRGLVLVNDPARRKLVMIRRESFDREWTAAHNWTLLAVPRSAE